MDERVFQIKKSDNFFQINKLQKFIAQLKKKKQIPYLSTDVKQIEKLLLRETQMCSSYCQECIKRHLFQLRLTSRLITVQLT